MIDLTNFKSNLLPKELQGLTLWRYMGIEELQDIFENKVIRLTPALKFNDPWEGYIHLEWVKRWERKLWSLADKAPIPDGYVKYYIECVKHNTFIKCFHNADVESDAMWRLYTPKGKGVAIKIDSDELSSPVFFHKPKDLHCDIEAVTYVKEYTEEEPVMKPETMYYFKRKAFEHEKEIRIIGTNIGKAVEEHNQIVAYFNQTGQWDAQLLVPDFGQSVPIEPTYVIKSIIVNPFDDGSVVRDVIALVNKYKFRNEVKRSALYTAP